MQREAKEATREAPSPVASPGSLRVVCRYDPTESQADFLTDSTLLDMAKQLR